MPKYYVRTGALRCVIDRPDHAAALNAAFRRPLPPRLGSVTLVSEKGFGGNHDDDVWVATRRVLEETRLRP